MDETRVGDLVEMLALAAFGAFVECVGVSLKPTSDAKGSLFGYTSLCG